LPQPLEAEQGHKHQSISQTGKLMDPMICVSVCSVHYRGPEMSQFKKIFKWLHITISLPFF